MGLTISNPDKKGRTKQEIPSQNQEHSKVTLMSEQEHENE
jgi:hypothetical protein